MNNNEKLTVTEAVSIWMGDTSDGKRNFLNQVMRRRYVPCGEKIYLARLAQTTAHTVKNDKGEVVGYEMDGLQTYFQNVIAVVDSYTNIDIANGDTIQNYDALQERGIIKAILGDIGDDLTEWTRVWNLTSENFFQNHFTTRGWLENTWRKIVKKVAHLQKSLRKELAQAIEKNPDLADTFEASGFDIQRLIQNVENNTESEKADNT